MPQLDFYVFIYQNINFILSFYFLFFMIHFFVFPYLFKNIYFRKTLISRTMSYKLDNSFCLILFLNYNQKITINYFLNILVFFFNYLNKNNDKQGIIFLYFNYLFLNFDYKILFTTAINNLFLFSYIPFLINLKNRYLFFKYIYLSLKFNNFKLVIKNFINKLISSFWVLTKLVIKNKNKNIIKNKSKVKISNK